MNTSETFGKNLLSKYYNKYQQLKPEKVRYFDYSLLRYNIDNTLPFRMEKNFLWRKRNMGGVT